MRFVRYTSTEKKKDLYFPIYIGSLESNLMQMVLAKEKLTMFMKGAGRGYGRDLCQIRCGL